MATMKQRVPASERNWAGRVRGPPTRQRPPRRRSLPSSSTWQPSPSSTQVMPQKGVAGKWELRCAAVSEAAAVVSRQREA